MGPIPKLLSLVLLVGGLHMAVAMAGEPACDGPYKGRTLTLEELTTVVRNHEAWLGSDRKPDDQRKTNLCQANLEGADLRQAKLKGANLWGVNLREANLWEANLWGVNLRGAHDLWQAKLQGAYLWFAKLQGAYLRQANLRKAVLEGADLEEADLFAADLHGATLQGANLRGTYLSEINLEGVNLQGANLQGAYLSEAKLQGASLFYAEFQEATLIQADLQGADLRWAKLAGAIYEPPLGSLPNLWSLAVADGLERLVFHNSPASLVELREAFKKGGMRTQERQLTYAIEHTKMLQAWHPTWHDPKREDGRPWPEQLAGKSESLFSYVLFDLPSAYGMAPSRALATLGVLILVFALVYMVALVTARGRASG